MGRIWEDQNKYQRWLDVELAAVATLAEQNIIPKKEAEEIRSRANFSVDRINEIEAEVKHDVIAFTTNLAESIGDAARFVHYGLTSSDVVDTANALLLRDACDIILKKIDALLDVLKRRAFEFQHTPTIGRTHGVHAEPTTFGLKLANWYSEIERDIARFEHAAEDMRVGKISGAVGTLAHLTPELERFARDWKGRVAEAQSAAIVRRLLLR